MCPYQYISSNFKVIREYLHLKKDLGKGSLFTNKTCCSIWCFSYISKTKISRFDLNAVFSLKSESLSLINITYWISPLLTWAESFEFRFKLCWQLICMMICPVKSLDGNWLVVKGYCFTVSVLGDYVHQKEGRPPHETMYWVFVKG